MYVCRSVKIWIIHHAFSSCTSFSIFQLQTARLIALELEAIEKMSGYLGIASSDFISIRNMFVPETDSSYKILEIEQTATDEEVKKAYRRMAMKYHPDKVSHLGEEFRKTAEDKFKKVNEAYEKIKKERNII